MSNRRNTWVPAEIAERDERTVIIRAVITVTLFNIIGGGLVLADVFGAC